ncbi:hypothetical protein JAAARDRAFT_301105 [Jaapia argillacea MUCL 33604]|uniref:Uncharacterized protein n=1 Tax=Jaapia argillacea MUCL 33604 TaxID=933084 RepID=A0A067PZT8_9AGAM|nr:hypothetical protein JAAARDRAFT_301105 [Jaapia argillacea MUCL 33604]
MLSVVSWTFIVDTPHLVESLLHICIFPSFFFLPHVHVLSDSSSQNHSSVILHLHLHFYSPSPPLPIVHSSFQFLMPYPRSNFFITSLEDSPTLLHLFPSPLYPPLPIHPHPPLPVLRARFWSRQQHIFVCV